MLSKRELEYVMGVFEPSESHRRVIAYNIREKTEKFFETLFIVAKNKPRVYEHYTKLLAKGIIALSALAEAVGRKDIAKKLIELEEELRDERA